MDLIEIVKKELNLEAEAINKIAERIDENIIKAIDILYNCKGKVVVTGMGKTGIIARKIAATLSSTGTTSIFLHAAEGIHGDLGILQKDDVVIAVSTSGNTQELISIIPFIKFMKIPIISITGNKQSQLAKNSDVVIDCYVPKEYEPFGLVPTASTTVTLAIGDAIAVALLKKRDFKETDFAKFHPGGTIGKKLIYKVDDLMHTGDKNPIVENNVKMDKVILEMTSKGLGCTNVIDENGKLVGIVTDGDLRRFLAKGITDLNVLVLEAMTVNPKSVNPETLAVDALNLMEENKITMLPVVDKENIPVGMLHMHDLIDAGVVG
ncbi:MAG: KpsF/GutQ family sugar-phosphate isomerase [Candidatus Cloacimonetes bacterium]|nr:KpsF/GutQ family sugar-phosphate isomerase [Candidatus Cloacimonadota bacterium]